MREMDEFHMTGIFFFNFLCSKEGVWSPTLLAVSRVSGILIRILPLFSQNEVKCTIVFYTPSLDELLPF